MREDVAFVVAGVFAGCLVAVVLHHSVSTNKIKKFPPQLRSPSASSRYAISVTPPRSGLLRFVSTDARLRLISEQAASTRSDLPNKQPHYIKRWFDELAPLDPDRELLQSPATTFKSSFDRPVCAFNTPSIRLQPILSTVSHLSVRAPGASTAVRRRAHRPPPLCCCCFVYLV
jgi:hypothetical protein